MKQIKVGSLVQDKVSRFIGRSIARCTYLNGCIQHEVQAKADENNKMQPNLWIDEEQLEDLTPIPKTTETKPRRRGVVHPTSKKKGGGQRGHRKKDLT